MFVARRILTIVTILVSTVSVPGQAQVYQCKDDSGRVVFSDTACAENAKIINLKKYNKAQRPAASPFYCASGITAVINNLSYPNLTDVNEAIRQAESNLTSLRYRKIIRRVDPDGELPDKVSKVKAEAFPASEVPGFSNGVVVNVRICK
jgi:hypothetical protein